MLQPDCYIMCTTNLWASVDFEKLLKNAPYLLASVAGRGESDAA
jgi:hypothetical protein